MGKLRQLLRHRHTLWVLANLPGLQGSFQVMHLRQPIPSIPVERRLERNRTLAP